jgi:glycosyltransferase involved in cell wall biosynthesis
MLRTYLWPSETFLYGQIVGDERWRSIVVARRTEAPDRFPLGTRRLLLTTEGSASMGRAWADVNYRARRLSAGEAERTSAAMASENVALVHAHYGTDARFFRPVWKRLDVPVIVSFYGYDARKAPSRFFGLGARYMAAVIEESARLVVPSRDMAEDLVALGADEKRIVVLPWGIDTRHFRPVERTANGRVHFATACRFTEKKGVHVLIDAFARVVRAGVDAELTLAGSGPLAAQYERQAANLHVAERVHFPGFVSAEDLPRFLASQDVFVLASITAADGDKEGTPTVLMEAQAMGLPVVATKHGGIVDVVEDEGGGYLVDEGDAEALGERLVHLARRRDEWPRLGARGRQHVLANFDAAQQNRRREELYDQVVAG